MYNDPFNQQPQGIDYLNQIAAPAPPQGFDRKTKLILAIFGMIGLLSLAFIFYSANQTTSGPSLSSTIISLNKLQTITDKYRGQLRTSKIIDTNSSLNAILTTAAKSAEPLAAAEGINLKDALKEPGLEVELTKKLDDAFLNATLDAVYIREMTFQLESLITQMEQLARRIKRSEQREWLTKTTGDLRNIQKQLTAPIAER